MSRGPVSAAVGTAAVRAEALTKLYGDADSGVRALDELDCEFEAGRFTAVMGPSGSGKSTLLHCLSGLDRPTSGKALLGDEDLTRMSERRLTLLRRRRLGFVFQSFNLVPTLTAQENIEFPLRLAGESPDPEWFNTVVSAVDLHTRLGHRPSELSGGQQQRVAVARAVITRPAVLFADEPTGNLDSHAGSVLLGFLRRSVDEFGQCVVMVTHDAAAAAYADRVVFLADGRLAGELVDPTHEAVLDRLKTLRAAQPAD